MEREEQTVTFIAGDQCPDTTTEEFQYAFLRGQPGTHPSTYCTVLEDSNTGDTEREWAFRLTERDVEALHTLIIHAKPWMLKHLEEQGYEPEDTIYWLKTKLGMLNGG